MAMEEQERNNEFHILLVEDDPSEQLIVRKMLAASMDTVFHVEIATSLKTALQVLNLRPEIDLVLLDLSLPDAHGYETITEFTKYSEVPFVVLTGNDDTMLAKRSKRLGAEDYLVKREFQDKLLIRTIVTAIDHAESTAKKQIRDYQTLTQILPGGEADAAMLRPRLLSFIEVIDDIERFIRTTAPNLASDIDMILDKHHVTGLVKDTRSLIRLQQEAPERKRRRRRERKISEAGFEVLEAVTDHDHKDGRESEPPLDWHEAESYFDQVAARGEE